MTSLNVLETVMAYHERTKHHFECYAMGPKHINWSAQPDSFRRYLGTKNFELPLVADTLEIAYLDLYQSQTIKPNPINLQNIAALLELSLGISAWKQYGSNRWALRCNPSSGNLHPTEGYLVLPNIENLSAGIYHYLSHDHILEQRGIFDNNGTKIVETLLSNQGFLLGLTSIPWREAWKYGERAFRYCQHDIGHAIAAIRYAAATLGWTVQLLENWADEDIIQTLGLDQSKDFYPNEPEVPEIMLSIHQEKTKPLSAEVIISTLKNIKWVGKANQLDSHHDYEWPIINKVFKATLKPSTKETDWIAPTLPALPPIPCTSRATHLIRQRRSAQMFDGKTPLNVEAFYRLLDTTLPRNGVMPWDVFPHQPRLHLILFVHRITGLPPGLYIFLRHQAIENDLRKALQREEFDWKKPENCPEHINCYQLLSGDAQAAAQQLSCHQDIAANSAFSLGMLAEFEDSLQKEAWHYRRLFWEAGMIGQILYLEAEAAGIRGTGIGCYFDDAVHNLLGLNGIRYQSMYHFTIGTPLYDKRLQTLRPYAHLGERSKKKDI